MIQEGKILPTNFYYEYLKINKSNELQIQSVFQAQKSLSNLTLHDEMDTEKLDLLLNIAFYYRLMQRGLISPRLKIRNSDKRGGFHPHYHPNYDLYNIMIFILRSGECS